MKTFLFLSSLLICTLCYGQDDLLNYHLTAKKDSLMYYKVSAFLKEPDAAIAHKQIFADTIGGNLRVYMFKVWAIHAAPYLCVRTNDNVFILKKYEWPKVLKELNRYFKKYKVSEAQQVTCIHEVFEVLMDRALFFEMFPKGRNKE